MKKENETRLRKQLLSSDASTRRGAAYELARMQEDGLKILTDTLFGDFHVIAKNAAAYGLRKMQGRMKKLAVGALNQGLKHRDRDTYQVCQKALQLLNTKTPIKKQNRRHKKIRVSHESTKQTRVK